MVSPLWALIPSLIRFLCSLQSSTLVIEANSPADHPTTVCLYRRWEMEKWIVTTGVMKVVFFKKKIIYYILFYLALDSACLCIIFSSTPRYLWRAKRRVEQLRDRFVRLIDGHKRSTWHEVPRNINTFQVVWKGITWKSVPTCYGQFYHKHITVSSWCFYMWMGV